MSVDESSVSNYSIPCRASVQSDLDEEICKFPYKLGATLGSGSQAVVRIGECIETGEVVAVKVIKKKGMSDHKYQQMEKEISLLCMLHHPNIVQLKNVFENPNHMYIVMEYVDGGTLFSILRKNQLSKKKAFVYMHTILHTMAYCHQNGVCHRDLKPENILVDNKGHIKIADFGMASHVPKTGLMDTICGSMHYASPEVLNGQKYDGRKADVWSCGVLFYAMMFRCLPFDHPSLIRKISQGEYNVQAGTPIGQEIFLRSMMTVEPKDRSNLIDLTYNPWWIHHCRANKLDPSSLKVEIQNKTMESIASVSSIPSIASSSQGLTHSNPLTITPRPSSDDLVVVVSGSNSSGGKTKVPQNGVNKVKLSKVRVIKRLFKSCWSCSSNS